MLVIAGSIRLAEADVAAAMPAAKRMIEETRKEAGCIEYGFYQDILDPGRIQIYEEWEDAASLEAHAASDHMKAWRAALSTQNVLSRDLKIMNVDPAAVKPLG